MAAHVVAAQEEDLGARLNDIAGPKGVRIALDAVGGPSVEGIAAAMSAGGMLFEYGGLSPEPTPFPLGAALGKSLTMRGHLVHEIVRDPIRLAAAKDYIRRGMVSGTLRPIIAKTFPFECIAEAHRYLESNEQFGKVVVTMAG